jgi:hypothetical protein
VAIDKLFKNMLYYGCEDRKKLVETAKRGLSMPLRKTDSGWTFGGATYSTREKAQKAYRAYLAKKHSKGKK